MSWTSARAAGSTCSSRRGVSGPTGFVYGLDATVACSSSPVATRLRPVRPTSSSSTARSRQIPLDDASVDVVISNCVIVLSGDKDATFAEIARVLRPGGRIGISDIVRAGPDDGTPTTVSCAAGAITPVAYEDELRHAGLGHVEVTLTDVVGAGLSNVIISAVKPETSIRPMRDADRPVVREIYEAGCHAGSSLEAADERLDVATDLVADRSHRIQAQPGGVVELPVLVALTGKDRAGVTTAHGHDTSAALTISSVQGLGSWRVMSMPTSAIASIAAALTSEAGSEPPEYTLDAVAGEVLEPAGGHLESEPTSSPLLSCSCASTTPVRFPDPCRLAPAPRRRPCRRVFRGARSRPRDQPRRDRRDGRGRDRHRRPSIPKPWTDEIVRAADVVVTMGAVTRARSFPVKRYEDWELDHPAGRGVDAVRPIRDEIRRRVETLIGSLQLEPV